MLKHSIPIIILCVSLVAGAKACLAADATVDTRETATRGEAVEMHLSSDQALTPWLHDPSIFEEDEGDHLEIQEVIEPDVKTIKLDNMVPPIQFPLGKAEIPENYLEMLRHVLDNMRDRTNVRLHFVGHADSLPLSGALQEIFGDNTGLSRERAGTTAEYFQQVLGLPAEAISYEGLGESQPVASNETETGRQLNRRVEVQVWYDEIGEKLVEKEVIVPQEVYRLKVCRTETVCKLRYKEGHSHRARVKNLIAPLHYDEGMLVIPEEFHQQVSHALRNFGGKQNVVVKFTAYTDNRPLTGRVERIYGNHIGFSKAVARRVALAVQDGLGLPNSAIVAEGRGAAQPAAPNDTEQGRALNRRIEVEFWHDDPLQDLPDEPQICPDAAGSEMVTRVYDSPSGGIDPILFENGQPIIPAGTIERLHRIMDEIKDRANVRLRFVGYTSNERLERRTAAVYGDDIGWSTARARRAMASVSDRMALTQQQAEFEGRGYVQSDDVINTGFIESDTSRVQVQIVYDELAILDNYEGVDITRLTRQVSPANPFGLNLMRITVDGKPIDDPGKSLPDVQRCIDVELEKAKIEFKHDNLKLEPRLNVTAWPRAIRYQDLEETEFAENLMQFRLYTNYRSFIERAEVRIFEEEQSERDTPFAVIALDGDGMGQWQPRFDSYSAPGHHMKYLVRVYDGKGRFDETAAQPLWVVGQVDPSVMASNPHEELLVGYGESRIANRNIPLRGGTVQAHGSTIPAEHGVWLAGHAVPVDREGRFIAEEILPDGMHTVEVAVLDKSGNGELFLRDLELDKSDWFTVGIADLTLSANKTNGPARLLAPDRPQYSDDMDLQGRLAFYTKGKFGEGWSLTASADTREGPLDEIFTNFMDKSPDALFRRLDPDYHFPTFGDDGTVTEDAPTMGKFYLKLANQENYGLWGNFKVGYTDTYLAHVDRGLYGANLHYQTSETTSFGEQRFMADGFAAEPGTLAGRDEFRGTSGSLYFLRRQDVLEGSERVRIEIRDKDSGLVIGAKNLSPGLDYDLDYLQGRILMSRPLSGTADDNLLVQSGSFSGHPVYLVVRYEFTPGVDDLDKLATGGRVHYWFDDHVKLGLTASNQEDGEGESNLTAADVTFRKSSESWLRVETGRSEGPGVLTTTTWDGGFDFDQQPTLNDTDAMAYRLDASIGFKDYFKNGRGQATFYLQDFEAGYSAPGEATDRDLTQYGAAATLPLTDRLGLRFKADRMDQRNRPGTQAGGLETQTAEVDVDYQVDEHWTVSTGVRHDKRDDKSTTIAPTQEEGTRTDMVAKLLYDTGLRWSAYGFVQESLQATGTRDDNARIGTGGNYRVTDRFNVTGEVSEGDLGESGRLGTEYLYSDRTNLYLNYALENERTDNGLRARKGNLASGFRTRYSDSASIYLEERYTHGDVPTGLIHSTGVDLAPTDRLNLGANLDFGTLQDNQTGAELKRTAAGVSLGYGFDKLKIASALEFRVDDTEDPGTGDTSKRTTWLVKNSLKYQLSSDWRLIGKFNYAHSNDSRGEAYDGDYTEAVIGYAYRPVHHDRLNALIKYTFFYNLPAAEQSVGLDAASSVIQRSHIGAVDVMYDLTQRWTVGGKYAYRHGEVSQDRVDREFFTSRAHLYVVRADWHFLHRWDAVVEARVLDLPDAYDQRSGALLGLYRHMGNHVKVGVGYNFSDFSDDLTDLDYKHQGLFINLIGKM
ncbi:MAG: OmpA family protein [Desulfuromonadales bacterium]|nr:OmpA family protein [Desulfuromonadales bacterium]